jgi:hypothetical protein
VSLPPLPSLEALGLHIHARRLGDLLVDWREEWGPLPVEYAARLDSFAASRWLYCPRCRALLCVDMTAADDDRNFRASCAECYWPGTEPPAGFDAAEWA